MPPFRAEFIGGPFDGLVFWSRGERVWEMPEPHGADPPDRHLVYRRIGRVVLRNGLAPYFWAGYAEGDVLEMKLL